MRIQFCLIVVAAFAACSGPVTGSSSSDDAPDATIDDAVDAGGGDGADDMGGDPAFAESQVVFEYGDWTIPAGGEQYPCAQWTLGNDKPLYVNAVIQANDGGFHHSNWYAVSDDEHEGPDGFFECADRNFQEAEGATFGDVVFAQSTQAYVETQRFPEGVAIKIPPNSKIIGGLHLLNVSATPLETGVRMGLELVHPRDVEVVATPWRMDNAALRIPAQSEVRFKADCRLKDQYEFKTDEPFEPLLYWLLPHYHGLGNYFRVDLIKPEGDETILELEGFNAEANGVTFAEPISLAGVTGMRMVCGYHNPYDEIVSYGVEGDDEMCTLLAFTDAAMRLNTSVWEEESVDQSEGMETHVGKCSSLFIPKNEGQSMPTEEEKAAPLYVPESNDSGDVTLVPECRDTPADAEPDGEATLASIRGDILVPSCAYSSCHDADAPAAGLDFTTESLHAELLAHEPLAQTSKAFIEKGQPGESWFYEIVSRCEPRTDGGTAVSMPRNSPTLLDAGQVARIRQWIADGANDD